MSARSRGALPPGAHGDLVEQFVLELATLRSRTHRLLSRTGRTVVDPLAELRSDSSGRGYHVLSLMDEIQASFRRIRQKLEGQSGFERGRQPPRSRASQGFTAYFSDRGRPFQSDRGRSNSVIVDAPGRRASPGLNVTLSASIERMIEQITQKFGAIHVLFDNAASARWLRRRCKPRWV